MEYIKMTQEEINAIVRRGGDKLTKLNRLVSEHLEGLELSQPVRAIIDNTDLNNMADVFGGLFTVKEVEDYIIEYYVVDDVLELYIDMVGEAGEDRAQDLEKNIDCVVNDIVCGKYPEYSREQQAFIIEKVKVKYNEL